MVTAFKEGRFVGGDKNGLPIVEAPPLKVSDSEVAKEEWLDSLPLVALIGRLDEIL